ncbi:hypothetical protein [Spiroplasma taiwanense]|uniref:Septation ring formation regulator n=1 Tax=Spiroplasma taiwanense CT-1 TaxID=1276220 RepID=S5LY88_9MOLU|nr:hypothetical protein [Spiroplasma taiwanense]AGR41551.1 hypothetical protein STAIW_v1c09650 [Spiroplasma taiwanense CT-1]
MFLNWDLNNLLNNTSNIVSLAIFFVCLGIAIIILILINIYRKILQTIAKSIDLIDDLKKSPLRYRLQRISIIFEETNNLENELMIWRTKYELLFEKELCKCFIELVSLLEKKKNTFPNIGNLNKFRVIYDQLLKINQNVHQIFIETLSALEIEYIQRDSLTFQKELFRMLKDEVIMTTFKDIRIDQEKLGRTIDSIEKLFSDFYLELDDGKYKESWDCLLKIDQALIFLIELLDSIPYVISTITTLVPQLMSELKNKHVTFGLVERKLPRNARKYAELELEVDKLRVKINNELLKLQFKKANKSLKQVFVYIENFKKMVEHEDNLKAFFENKIEDIRSEFDLVSNSTRQIERVFKNMESMSKYPTREKSDFEAARAEYLKTKEKADFIFSSIDLEINGKELDLFKTREELLVVMEQLLKNITMLEKSAKAIESKNTNIESIINQIIFIQTTLNQCDVKINQYKSIRELEKFIEPIQELYFKLSKFSKENLTKIESEKEKEILANEIEEYSQKTWRIVSDLNDTIFLDYISQEIIVYLERYVGFNKEIEKVILTCEDFFRQRNFDQLLGYSLPILGDIKKINKR